LKKRKLPSTVNVIRIDQIVPVRLTFDYFRFFTQLPTSFYLEITQMLLAVASEDIPQGNDIKTAVKVS